jgi:hypothetical protein
VSNRVVFPFVDRPKTKIRAGCEQVPSQNSS